MSNPQKTFCNDLKDGDEITVVVGKGKRITGIVKEMNQWSEGNETFQSCDLYVGHPPIAWDMTYVFNKRDLEIRREGYDEETKTATVEEKHTVKEITIHE